MALLLLSTLESKATPCSVKTRGGFLSPIFSRLDITICDILVISSLVKRKNLDDVETIKKRLEVFKKDTFPVIEFAKKQGVNVIEINAEQTVSKIFEDISKHLN